MDNAFLTRLRLLTPLGGEDLAALAGLLADPFAVPGERQLVTEGDRPQRLHVLMEGWAARVKWLPDGRRHLCTLLLPGDICDIDGLHVQAYDYGVMSLTPCHVATIDRAALLAFCDERPGIARALAWLGFVDNSLLNTSAVSLARRSARQRLVHLFCELLLRLQAVGRAGTDSYDLPLTQERIADALGLTAVHVNRTIQQLRNDGSITTNGHHLGARDWAALKRQAYFSAGYLHLEGMRRTAG